MILMMMMMMKLAFEVSLSSSKWKIAQKWIVMNFPDHGVIYKVLDNSLILMLVLKKEIIWKLPVKNDEIFSKKTPNALKALIVVNFHLEKIRKPCNDYREKLLLQLFFLFLIVLKVSLKLPGNCYSSDWIKR